MLSYTWNGWLMASENVRENKNTGRNHKQFKMFAPHLHDTYFLSCFKLIFHTPPKRNSARVA